MTKRAIWSSAGVLVLVGIGGFLSTRPGGLTNARLVRYLIPAEYVGWVQVQYGVAHAAPLPTDRGGYLIRVPPTGVVQTSDKQVFSWEQREFYYVSGTHRRLLKSAGERGDGSMIWGSSTYQPGSGLGENGKSAYTTDALFFVGTEAQFKKIGPWIPPE